MQRGWVNIYFTNYAMLLINKTQQRNWQKFTSSSSPRKTTYDSLRNTYTTLTAIAARVYNVLLFNPIWPEIVKILRRNPNGFWRNCSTASHQFWQNPSNHWKVYTRKESQDNKDWVNTTFAYDLPKETLLLDIMILYKNMKAMVFSPDEHTDFINIVTGILQDDILVLYLFVLYLNYIPQTSIALIKVNSFTLK